MSFGLIRTFVIDKNMTVKTMSVSSHDEPRLLRNSIIRLLSWLQRTALVREGHYNLKSNLEKGISFNYETNKRLIGHYLDNKHIKEVIKSNIGKYKLNDITSNEIYVVKKNINVYILMVEHKHGIYQELVPLLSLYD